MKLDNLPKGKLNYAVSKMLLSTNAPVVPHYSEDLNAAWVIVEMFQKHPDDPRSQTFFAAMEESKPLLLSKPHLCRWICIHGLHAIGVYEWE